MIITPALIKHNPRVIDASASATLPWNPAAAIGLPAPAPHLTLHLGRLSEDQAALIRRQAQLVGAMAEASVDGTSHGLSVIIAATETQYDRLCATVQRLDSALCDVIRTTIEFYLRRRWLLKCVDRELELGPQPLIMGVVNVTPDSFSDGGKHATASAAVKHALALLEAGATVLDVGGESTRPGAEEVPAEEELARVLPVISELAKRQGALVSVDTRKPLVARLALDAGAVMINDITALADVEMARLAAESGCAVSLMHMQGEPRTMQDNPQYDEVVADIVQWLRQALALAAGHGIDLERTIVDPGIGFGKTLHHNLSLLGRLRELRSLGRPILVGPSRKRFIGTLTGGAPVESRLSGTIAACVWSRQCGAALFRVHDVDEVSRALAVTAGIEAAGDD